MQIKLVCTVSYHSYPANYSVYLATEIWPRCPEFKLFIEAEESRDARSGNTSKTQWPNNMRSLRESQRDAVSTLITSRAPHTQRMGVVYCAKEKLWKVICGARDSSQNSNDTLFQYWPVRSHSNYPSAACEVSLSSGSKVDGIRATFHTMPVKHMQFLNRRTKALHIAACSGLETQRLCSEWDTPILLVLFFLVCTV